MQKPFRCKALTGHLFCQRDTLKWKRQGKSSAFSISMGTCGPFDMLGASESPHLRPKNRPSGAVETPAAAGSAPSFRLVAKTLIRRPCGGSLALAALTGRNLFCKCETKPASTNPVYCQECICNSIKNRAKVMNLGSISASRCNYVIPEIFA